MERLIADIRKQPELFPAFDPPARRHFSTVFPYALIYFNQADRILILAMMHMKQRPGYWKRRLNE
jgi:toxin ParE1/3/4